MHPCRGLGAAHHRRNLRDRTILEIVEHDRETLCTRQSTEHRSHVGLRTLTVWHRNRLPLEYRAHAITPADAHRLPDRHLANPRVRPLVSRYPFPPDVQPDESLLGHFLSTIAIADHTVYD